MTSGKGKEATNEDFLHVFVCPQLGQKTPMNCIVPTTEEIRFLSIAVKN